MLTFSLLHSVFHGYFPDGPWNSERSSVNLNHTQRLVRPACINATTPLDVSIAPELHNHVIPEPTTTKRIILQNTVVNVLKIPLLSQLFVFSFRFRGSNLNSRTELNIRGSSEVTLKAVSHDFTYQERFYTSASESPAGKIRMSLSMPILKITLRETFCLCFPWLETNDHFYTLYITVISSQVLSVVVISVNI